CVAGGAYVLSTPVTCRERSILRVVEGRVQPVRRAVTVLARRRKELWLCRWARIGCVVVIRLVAADTSGGQRGVVVVDVAVGALARRNRVRSGQREWGVVVVEGGISPNRGVVAQLTLLREPGRCVRRIRGAVVILQVTGDARRAVQGVVVVDVAVGALARRNRVRSRKSKPGGGVVEHSVDPLHGVVAGFAGGGEARVRHRSGRVVVVFLVARYAGGAGQVVVVVHVAVGALPRWNRVRSGQHEAGAVVIERGVEPGRSAVARIASLRKIRRDVIGTGRSLVVLQVAGYARPAGQV